MKKLLIAGLAAAAFYGAPALAADMAVKAPPIASAPALSWTGFYIGANAGYGWGANNGPITYTNDLALSVTSRGPDAKGGFGGGQIGYNWQTGTLVLGLEADFQAAGISNTVTGITSDGSTAFSANQKLNWFGTVRGRVGYAFDRALVYVTGGYAGGHVSDTAVLSTIDPAPATAPFAGSTQRSGSTIGGGLEYSLAKNWSAKAEYQYINLGRENLFGTSTAGVTLTTSAIRDKFSTVRFGVNYYFN